MCMSYGAGASMHSQLFSEQMAVTAGVCMSAHALTVACDSACWASFKCMQSCCSHADLGQNLYLTKTSRLQHAAAPYDGGCIQACQHR